MIQYEGILLCEKPYGISSHKVVNILRETIGQKRIGHTGTLDPRATGLLVICIGRATKIAQFLSGTDKIYEMEIKLGARSSTYDSEGIIEDSNPQLVPDLTRDEVLNILAEFKGKIKQRVPAHSAVKVGGQRLYKLARQGKEVVTPEREIEIKDIELKKLELPYIYCNVSCSKGTYMRTLANDIGQRIGCGAYLSQLCRTGVGDFTLGEALNLNEIRYYREAGTLKRYILPIEKVLQFPSVRVSEKFSPHVISGQSPRPDDIVDISNGFNADEYISLKNYAGKIMAVGKSDISSADLKHHGERSFFTYVRVLN